MRRALTSTALICASLLAAIPLRAQEAEIEGSHYRVAEYWWGGALADSRGRFDYCDVNINHGEAIRLTYALRRDDVFLFMVRILGAGLSPGEDLEVGLASDTFSANKLEARALDSETFVVLVPGMEATLATVRPGTYLSVQLRTRNFMIPTPGGQEALDAAKACFERYSAPDTGSGAGSQGTATNELIEGSQFSAGIWRGFAMRKASDNGVACHVSLRGAFEEQINFILGSDNRFLIVMALPEARLQKGQVYDVSVKTNVEAAIAVPATAFDAKTLAVVLTDIGWAVSYLQDSQALTVTGENFQQLFSIANANLALDAAKTCLATHAPD
jgi:hypothetical protein